MQTRIQAQMASETTASETRSGSDIVAAAAVAFAAGIALVFLTGFASPDVLHNAAHDWRHSMSFPCH